MSLKDELNNFLQKYEGGGEVPKYQQAGRVNRYYEKSPYPFAYLNPATVLEYELQHADDRGVYNGVDLNDRLSWYEQNNPLLFRNHFQSKDNKYGLQDGKTWLDSQKFFNSQVDDTVKMLAEKYGLNEEELKDYANNIKYTSDSKNTSRGLDNKGGEYTTTRPMFQVPLVTEDEFKKLREKGIYTLRHIEDNPDVAKEIIGDKVDEIVKNFVGNADAVIGIITAKENSNPQPFKTLEEQTKTPEAKGDTNSKNGLTPSKTRYRMPVLEPDQRMPLEVGVDVGYLGRVEAPNLRKLNISAEPQINANFQAGLQALNQLKGAPGMSGTAMVASVLGQIQNANNQAIGQTTAQNQNIESQIERANEQGVATADQMNLELATNYNNQWLQGDANLDAMNRMISKFNNEVAVQNYTNQKMRNYLEDSLGIVVGDGMTVSDALKVNQMDAFNKMRAMQILGMQPQAVESEPKKEKKQRGGYIRNFIENYNKK